MKYKNWDNFKVHVTGISKIMARPKGCNDLTQRDTRRQTTILAKEEKTEEELAFIEFMKLKREKFLHPPLSETAKSYLIERYSSEKYNIRRASAGGKQKPTITKGVALENEGIELVSFVDKIKYQQPEYPMSNDYMIGECDILCYENKKIVDVKTSWNAANFMENRRDNRLSFYQWCQVQGYLELYDLDFGQVCYVLVNTPPHLVDQEKANLFRRYTFGEINRDKYDEEVAKYDSIYDYRKIPVGKRIIRFDVARFKEFIPFLYEKIGKCREWLNGFERTFLSNKNILTLPEDYINVRTGAEEDSTEYNPDVTHQGDQE
jgi:hypothetical protein